MRVVLTDLSVTGRRTRVRQTSTRLAAYSLPPKTSRRLTLGLVQENWSDHPINSCATLTKLMVQNSGQASRLHN